MRTYIDVPYKCPEIPLMGEPSIEKKKKNNAIDEMFAKKKNQNMYSDFNASKIYLW